MSRIGEQVGRVLGGRYRLLAAVGTGASAHVFLAEDAVLRRRVAVTLLHAALAEDESFLRRFRAEARTAASLSHPHVMAVHDWGEEPDGPYLVMELLGGGSLRALLDRGHPLTPSQAAALGLEAAKGLDYAHRRGLVHRDIKPANLLFDEEGRLRVADFGIARALAEAAWTEPSGSMVGSARYASPEQARGATLDGRSDVYSLALVLVEAVTGRVPFAADTTIATLMARLDTPLVAPSELGPLGPVVEHAGRPSPEERPDAGALAAALERVARALEPPEPLPLDEPLTPTIVASDLDRPDLTLLPGDPRPLLDDPAPAPPRRAAAADAPPLAAGRRRRRWPLAALVTLLALAVAAAGVLLVAGARVPSHAVPDVVNRTEAEARRALTPLEFEVKVKRRFVDGTTKGQVLDQDPDAGRSLKEGRTVTLTVSDGPPLVPVPDLAASDRAAAEARLTEAGFTVAVQGRFDEQAPAGAVLEWSGVGERHPKGTLITVIVSDGPQPRQVPDLAGRTFDEAASELAKLSLKAEKVEVFDDEVEKGRVVGTEPVPGQPAARDSVVKVKVSKGPDLVEVPDVRGRSAVEAERLLTEAGLAVSQVSGPPSGRVFATDPRAGAQVKRGSGVVLATRR